MIETSKLQRAQTLIANGNADEARTLLNQQRANEDCAVRLRELLVGEGENQPAAGIAQNLAVGTSAEAHVSRSFLLLQRGDPRSALQECKTALEMNPGLATAHNHAGRALNNLGRPGDALASLKRAVDCEPVYPEAWHNLGHVQRVMGDLPAACESFRHALLQAPAYRSAKLNLGKTLFNTEQIPEALECFESLVSKDPQDVEALVDGGLALHLLGQLDKSRRYYDRALALDDMNQPAYCYLGILLNELQDADGAEKALRTAVRLDPHDVEAWVELAGTHELCNRPEAAFEAVQKGLSIHPHYPPLHLEAAKLERRRGDFEAALRRLSDIDPRQLPGRLRKPYFFELANALDRSGETDGAYQAFKQGNELSARDIRRQSIDPDSFPRTCSWIEDWIARGAPGSSPQPDDPQDDLGEDLCFLVGFARSGTTLLDMMLDAHPHIKSIEEKPTLESVIQMLHAMPGGYPQSISGIDNGLLQRLRRHYRAQCTDHDAMGAGIIVDKMPLRFMHAGLINRLFPRSRMIFSLRHPCDVVLSNFMQQYPSNTDALILFDSLEQGAEIFDRTFRIWQSLEPFLQLDPHYLRYEDLVADAPSSLARICEYLGIDANPAMLETGARLQTRDRVTTPSYQQVTEPLYQRASGRWLRYRQYFESCLPLLLPHIKRYGYSAD
jgi:tetratricopeptide (TPR) repeat protein